MPACSRKLIVAVGGLVAIALTGEHRMTTADAVASPALPLPVAFVQAPTLELKTITAAGLADSLWPAARVGATERLAQQDPRALTRLARQRYEREVRDYTCVFLKQERIDGKLRDVEEIEVRYREDPISVYMIWKRNADQAKRVLFIDSPRFVNDKGEKLARVEPAGALVRLIVSDILMPIHGKRAQQSSRRSIDEFGFRATFRLLDHYNQLGADRGVLDFRYAGEGEIDGRRTYKLVRHLPYDGPGGLYPDATMVLHIDQQWLLPTAVYSYADRAGKVLLGSYVHTSVKLNPGLNDGAFQF